MKKLLKEWLPSPLIEYLKPIFKHGVYFSGHYSDWESASKFSTGYDVDIILERVKYSTLELIAGRAVFERDSVLFNRVQYSFPVLAGLLLASVKNSGRLSVLDYGGSLGSSYFQCANFLTDLSYLRWSVVEQAHFVRCGQEFIQSEKLKFYFNIRDVVSLEKPNVALLSSVLQYLPDPYSVLTELIENNLEYIIIDRTPFTEELQDVITLQHVPPSIYPASYPCRILSKQLFFDFFSADYKLMAEFTSDDRAAVVSGMKVNFCGMIYKRNIY